MQLIFLHDNHSPYQKGQAYLEQYFFNFKTKKSCAPLTEPFYLSMPFVVLMAYMKLNTANKTIQLSSFLQALLCMKAH